MKSSWLWKEIKSNSWICWALSFFLILRGRGHEGCRDTIKLVQLRHGQVS